MGDTVLKTINLQKRYGRRVVLDNINITINKGDIYGLIGKNGAGKTTFMRTCLGMTGKTSGECKFFEMEDINAARKKVGTLIEYPAIFKNASAKKNLEYYATLFGANRSEIDEILDIIELNDVAKRKVGKFSLGMKQRLGIGIAMLSHPELMILDEPINGLDPMGIKKIRNLILKLNKEQGITFLISSHLLDELGKIATKYGIIDNGRLVEEFSAEELLFKCEKKIVLEVEEPKKAMDILRKNNYSKIIASNENVLYLGEDGSKRAELVRLLVGHNIDVLSIYEQKQSLEQYFVERIDTE